MKLIANLVEWSKWDVNTIMDMPFTPTMLIVNAVINEQQRKDEEDKTGAPTAQNNDVFSSMNTLNLDKFYDADG